MGKHRKVVRSRPVTVASLLARDDIKGVLAEFARDVLPECEVMVLVYRTNSQEVSYCMAGASQEEALGLLLIAQKLLLDEGGE